MGSKYFASAPNQEYTKEFLKQIREEDLVIYDGKACHAVMQKNFFCEDMSW